MDLNTIIKYIVDFISTFMTKPVPVVRELPKPTPQQVKTVENVSFVLTHTRFCADGIFGELKKLDGTHVCYTLEHSYDNKPKLVDGIYNCLRGPHRLHSMTEDFTTFEIKGIPDFDGKPVTGVLFHWGNYNSSSEGCVLMGTTQDLTMIGNSRKAFANFMESLDGVDNFKLKVISNTH